MGRIKKVRGQRTWIPKYHKYLDELTQSEWEEMANATCGTDCDVPNKTHL